MTIAFPVTCKGVLPRQHANEALSLSTVTIPKIEDNEILLRVQAIGVNYADVLQAKGAYPPPRGAPQTLGLECSGIVVAKGSAVKNFELGDRVMSLVSGGAYAEYAVVQHETTLPIPKTLSFIEAAAIPEAYHTVWYNVFYKGQLKSGEIFLVHGGTSGVGSAAIQITKAMGAIVITTVGSDNKIPACFKLGADCVINHKKQDFAAVANEFTNKRGIDIILDWVGASYLEKHLKLLRNNGRLLCINSISGDEATLSFNRLHNKCLTITGSLLRPLPLAEKSKITQDIAKLLLPKLENGEIKPLIYQTLPLHMAEEAHRIMEDSKHIGKIILTVEV